MPSCSSEMPSSFSEQTIPSERTPRIVLGLSVLVDLAVGVAVDQPRPGQRQGDLLALARCSARR